MVAMYALSVMSALVMAAFFKRTLLKSVTPPLILELPPYRMPMLRSLVRRVFGRSVVFVRDAGTVILACSVVLWALLSYPKNEALETKHEAEIARLESEMSGTDLDDAITRLDNTFAGERIRASFAGRAGLLMEPVIAPLGFDWRIGIGLIGSFAAREVLISTLGLVYGLGADADENSPSLRETIRRDPHYTPLVGLSLMIFFLFACQCMSTLAVVRRETNSWRWPTFMFVYMTVLAYVASLCVYQGGRLLGLGA